jgi:hypothetical protein
MDVAQVLEAATAVEQGATGTEQIDGQTSNGVVQTSIPAADAVEADATSSTRVQEVVTEALAAPPAGADAGASDAMAIDEDTTVQRTTETTTVIVEANDGTVVQEQTTTTTEVTLHPTAVEDVPMEPDPEPSLLEQMVTAHATLPSDPAAITTVSRAEPVAPAPPLDIPAPAQAQPTIARTGYVFDPMMMLHCQDGYVPTADDTVEGGSGHPEEPMRIRRIFNRLADQGLVKRMKQLTFGQVTMEEILLVHSEDHWNKVQGTESKSGQYHLQARVDGSLDGPVYPGIKGLLRAALPICLPRNGPVRSTVVRRSHTGLQVRLQGRSQECVRHRPTSRSSR